MPSKLTTPPLDVFCNRQWEKTAIPELIEYIRIPNKSPAFDPKWESNGYMEEAVHRFQAWAQSQAIEGMSIQVLRLPKRTPLLYIDIAGDKSMRPVLLYGHLDKQPEFSGWHEGLGPWQPVLKEDKLYGRGGADDGYALFASLIAIYALQSAKIKHPHCVVIIEACEESGSNDLPFYLKELTPHIGQPELVICLDSWCGNYNQMWNTTSLRGLIGGILEVEILSEGIHSGDASGIVPSGFRIIRTLLDRIEASSSGAIREPSFNTAIPAERIEQAKLAAQILGEDLVNRFPLQAGTQPVSDDLLALILNRSWRPGLCIIGADHLPKAIDAGNVMHPKTALKLSLRLPPNCDAEAAQIKLKSLLENNPPYGAKVTFTADWFANGWHAENIDSWLDQALNKASKKYFGAPAIHMGEGGTIPFMSMLATQFPTAQFLITGVLGPHSNAHGPNEFLHLPTAKRLTACIADILAAYHQKQSLQ